MSQPSDFGFTGCLSKAGLAEGTNAATIKTAAPNGAGTDYAINGQLYHKADTDNIAMNALTAQAASTACAYLCQFDTSGNVTLKKGTELSAADYALANSTVEVPKPDANKCPFGVIKIVTAAATTFTSGTTDLSAANITETYYDIVNGVTRV